MRAVLTALVWIVSMTSLGLAALIVVAFIFMATSMDPSELIAAGTETWTDAAMAIAAFTGLLAMTALSLGLWHSARFRAVGLVLTAAEAGCVVWACTKIYSEYF